MILIYFSPRKATATMSYVDFSFVASSSISPSAGCEPWDVALKGDQIMVRFGGVEYPRPMSMLVVICVFLIGLYCSIIGMVNDS